MDKIKELRMTLVILVVGVFFISGCFFNNEKTITFKTNGGSEVKNLVVKSGSKVETAPVPTKEGYIFEGWYLDGEEYNFDKAIDEDITLIAKWIKGSFDETNVSETTTEPTTTTTTTTTATTSKKTSSAKANKTTRKTTKRTTKKRTTTTTTKKTTTVPTTTTQVAPLIPEHETPIIVPAPEEKLELDIKIETLKIEKEKAATDEAKVETKKNEDKTTKENEEKELKEYIQITRTKDDVNVVSEIEEEDLEKLLKSDMTTWIVTSNHAYTYEPIINGNIMILKGDENVTSFTIADKETSYIFSFNSEEGKWTIQYPTVSVGTGLDNICYKDLETALTVAKPYDTIRLLKDQEVTNLNITVPVTIEGDNHTITNKKGYLFNIEKIKFEEKDKLTINNLVLDIDSFIHVGKSKFSSIILNNITGSIKNEKIDKKENGEFENTSLLQQF